MLELSCLLKTASQVCLSSVIEEPLYLRAFLSSQNSKFSLITITLVSGNFTFTGINISKPYVLSSNFLYCM